jgi:hypothetical protein
MRPPVRIIGRIVFLPSIRVSSRDLEGSLST